jgi:TPR repeat protein
MADRTIYQTSDGKQFDNGNNDLAEYDANMHQFDLNNSSSSGSSGRQQDPHFHDQGSELYREAAQLQKAGKFDEAISVANRAINAGGPNRIQSYLVRANCYDDKGNYDQAIADFTEVINFGPKEKYYDRENHGKAYNNRGVCYYKKGEYEKAKADYKKAADLGEKNALDNLADMDSSILLAQGMDAYNAKDYAKAVELWQKAADMGDAAAMGNLGTCYINGSGVPKDVNKAIEFWSKSASKGDGIGCRNLGIAYRDGIGVKQDFAKAEELFNQAIAKGDEPAKAQLTKLKEMRGK